MRKAREGFTLTEMLVVIAIILLLASLILSGLQVAQRRSAVARARREIAQLVTAWSAYYADYHRFPYDEQADGTVLTEADEECVQILRGRRHSSDSGRFLTYRQKNPRGIPYMDFHHRADGLRDPWGNPYRIALDGNGNGSVNVRVGTPLSETLNASVAIWSLGADGTEGTGDDVLSWRSEHAE